MSGQRALEASGVDFAGNVVVPEIPPVVNISDRVRVPKDDPSYDMLHAPSDRSSVVARLRHRIIELEGNFAAGLNIPVPDNSSGFATASSADDALRPFPATERDHMLGFEGPFSEFERQSLDALHKQDDQLQAGVDVPPGLPAADNGLRLYLSTELDRQRGFEGPFSEFERQGLDALHAQDAQRSAEVRIPRGSRVYTPRVGARTAHGDPHDDPSSSSSTSSSSSDRVRRKKKKTKAKKERSPSRSSSQHRVIRVKATDMKLGQWPTTLQFAGWRRALRLAVAGSCDEPDMAKKWIFAVEDRDCDIADLKSDPKDPLRALDGKLADALARLVKGEPARRIALEAEKAALSADLLSGRQTLWMIYKEFERDDATTDHIAHGHLERMTFSGKDALMPTSTWRPS